MTTKKKCLFLHCEIMNLAFLFSSIRKAATPSEAIPMPFQTTMEVKKLTVKHPCLQMMKSVHLT